MIYLIGSLRNPQVPRIAEQLRDDGHDVFDQWYASGPEADDKWKEYEVGCGHSFVEALNQDFARTVFQFDYLHLQRADTVVLVLPAGKSGHLEFGWAIGQGKRGFILLDSPDRWDMMYQFATGVVETVEELLGQLQTNQVGLASGRGAGNLSRTSSRNMRGR